MPNLRYLCLHLYLVHPWPLTILIKNTVDYINCILFYDLHYVLKNILQAKQSRSLNNSFVCLARNLLGWKQLWTDSKLPKYCENRFIFLSAFFSFLLLRLFLRLILFCSFSFNSDVYYFFLSLSLLLFFFLYFFSHSSFSFLLFHWKCKTRGRRLR